MFSLDPTHRIPLPDVLHQIALAELLKDEQLSVCADTKFPGGFDLVILEVYNGDKGSVILELLYHYQGLLHFGPDLDLLRNF